MKVFDQLRLVILVIDSLKSLIFNQSLFIIIKAFTKQRTLQLTMDMESTTFKLKDEGVRVFEPLKGIVLSYGGLF